MLTDLRDALRQLRKAPGFTATAIITLALGIGATTAIFTLVHQVMLKSLPVSKPEELWRIGDKIRCCNWGGYNQGDDNNFSLFSWEAYNYFRDHTPEFSDLAASSGRQRPARRSPRRRPDSRRHPQRPVRLRKLLPHLGRPALARPPLLRR
jgi:putative ABC transport system permease protein